MLFIMSRFKTFFLNYYPNIFTGIGGSSIILYALYKDYEKKTINNLMEVELSFLECYAMEIRDELKSPNPDYERVKYLEEKIKTERQNIYDKYL